MGYLVLPVIICLIISYAVACLWKCPLSYTIPGTIIGIDIVLFLMYLFGLVHMGVWGIIVLAIGALVFIVYCAWGRRLAKIDFPIILFIVGLIGVAVYCRGNIVREWDSLRLWGGYPKALYYTGQIQLGDSAWVGGYERTYIPGMPLLVNFFETFFPDFREDVIFVVYAFFHMSFFLPALGKVKNKMILLLGLPLMVLTPLLFFNSYRTDYYKVLYIDPCLGMALGYLVYTVSVWDMEDKKSVCTLLLAMCGVILLKDMGTVFVVIVLLGCGVKLMKQHILLKVRNLVFFLPFLLYFMWSIVAAMYGRGSQAVLFSVENLFQGEAIRKFLHYITHAVFVITLHGRLNPYLTILNFLVFFTACGFGLQFIMKKAEIKGNYKNAFGSMLAIQIIYLICLYISTLSVDRDYISTIRYESALMLGFFLFLLLVFLDNCTVIVQYIIKRKIWLCPIVAACLCIAVSFPMKAPKALESSSFESAEYASERIRELIPGNANDPMRVCILLDGHDALMLQRTYFNLIGETFITWASIELVDEDREEQENIDMLLNRLENHPSDYIFTLDNADTLSQYNDLFQEEPENYTLYTIKRDGEKIILMKADG